MKPTFKIGQSVQVNLGDEVGAKYDNKNYRVIGYIKDYLNEYVDGKITGMKTFQEGQIRGGYKYHNYYDFEPEYSTPYLDVKDTIKVWGVRLGYINRELYFFEEDIIKIDDRDIPYKYVRWTDEEKEWMSKESKHWPRDEKGRFV